MRHSVLWRTWITFLTVSECRAENLACCHSGCHLPFQVTTQNTGPCEAQSQHDAAYTCPPPLLLPAGPENHLTSFISFQDIRSQAGLVPRAIGPPSCPFSRENHTEHSHSLTGRGLPLGGLNSATVFSVLVIVTNR